MNDRRFAREYRWRLRCRRRLSSRQSIIIHASSYTLSGSDAHPLVTAASHLATINKFPATVSSIPGTVTAKLPADSETDSRNRQRNKDKENRHKNRRGASVIRHTTP